MAKLVVKAGRYTDRSLPTASWYDVHELTPGSYPLEPVTVNYCPVPEGEKPYYYVARVPSVVIEEYWVNQAFAVSSSETTHPNRPDTVAVTLYDYQVKAGRRVLDGCGEIIED